MASAQPTVRELLASRRACYSFEFFPPADADGERRLWSAVDRLRGLDPAFVSVTYGAGGSTRDRSVRLAHELVGSGLTTVAHLTCVGATRAELGTVVGEFIDAGVANLLALRGDPPGGPGAVWEPHAGGLDHADELVELIGEIDDGICVGVAATTQPHPGSGDLERDARVLARKARLGAQFAITQLFFEAREYVELVERAARHGCHIPIIPGLMPITNAAQLERFAQMAGVPIPAWLVERIERVRHDRVQVRQVGLEVAVDLARGLLDAGAPGLHTYTLNRAAAATEIFDALGLVRSGV
ncbi:MAG: methylenetetrahydrofolate reductase [Actinomycetales bacterium]